MEVSGQFFPISYNVGTYAQDVVHIKRSWNNLADPSILSVQLCGKATIL